MRVKPGHWKMVGVRYKTNENQKLLNRALKELQKEIQMLKIHKTIS